jgi:hypothetical protein
VIIVVMALLFVYFEASVARATLRDGHGKVSILPMGLPSPWGGHVADISWAEAKPADAPVLPVCALYLGEAGNTAVLYDAARKQTWRLPNSAVIVTVKTDRDEC